MVEEHSASRWVLGCTLDSRFLMFSLCGPRAFCAVPCWNPPIAAVCLLFSQPGSSCCLSSTQYASLPLGLPLYLIQFLFSPGHFGEVVFIQRTIILNLVQKTVRARICPDAIMLDFVFPFYLVLYVYSHQEEKVDYRNEPELK